MDETLALFPLCTTVAFMFVAPVVSFCASKCLSVCHCLYVPVFIYLD